MSSILKRQSKREVKRFLVSQCALSYVCFNMIIAKVLHGMLQGLPIDHQALLLAISHSETILIVEKKRETDI